MTIDLVLLGILQAASLLWIAYRVRTEPETGSERLKLGTLLGPWAHRRPVAWALERVRGWDDVTALVGIFVVVSCLWLGAELVEEVGEQESLVRADVRISEWIERARPPAGIRAAEWLSVATGPRSWAVFGVALGAILLWCRRWGTALSLALGTAGTSVTTSIVKAALGRDRPAGDAIYDPGGAAFPSGHTSGTAFAVFFLAWLVTRHRDRVQRSWAFAAATGFTVLIGAARMTLAVHWASDILGGAAVGLAWAVVAVLAARAWPQTVTS